jgi:type IV pilus assembly protein PilM
MFDKPTSNQSMSLELDSFALRIAALSSKRGKPFIEDLVDLPIEPRLTAGADVKPLYSDDQKAWLESLAKDHIVVTSLSTVDILIRPLELALKKTKEIDAVLSFQAEPLLPYAIENGIVDRIILSKEKEGSKLAVLAARKDHIESHINQWKAIHIDPEIITADPVALTAFGTYFAPSISTYYGVYLGYTHSFCTLVIDGKLITSQAISNGLNDLIIAIDEGSGIGIPAAQAALMSNSWANEPKDMEQHIKAPLEAWRMAIMRTILALSKQARGLDIDAILIAGPGSTLEGLTEAIASGTNKTSVVCEAETTAALDEKKLKDFALSVGGAISALPSYTDQINFRKPPFAFSDPWKRLKRPLAMFLGLCLGLTCALFLFGNAYARYTEANLKQEYLDLLTVVHKTYDEYEMQLPVSETEKGISIDELTNEQIQSRLNIIEKEIQAIPQISPLQPNVPLVSDVLAWLSSHNSFVQKEGKDSTEALKIEILSYTMVKRPEPTKKQERYQVKIELEVSSPTPKLAREFHDALIEPNDFVDSKGEIKWSSSRDHYKTSFFLKDKTMYPTE